MDFRSCFVRVVRSAWCVAALSVCAFLIAGFYIHDWHQRETAIVTTTRLIAELVSPDRQWRASVIETMQEAFLSTIVEAELKITSVNNPSLSAVILDAETGGNNEEEPKIKWTSPTTLEVTIYYPPYVGILQRDIDDVHVNILVDPSAAARIAVGKAYRNKVARSADRAW